MTIRENISLKPYNTFGIDVKTRFFIELLTEEDVFSFLYETGKFTLNKLAEDFKVSKGCISHIIKGRSWKWLEN